jgi:tetratricopeptide (TPR) repeat protein
MPAHIYQRVGRYADATEVNRRAVAVDLGYMDRTDPPGYYAMYLSHNYGFMAFSAAMEGRSQESIEAARHSADAAPPEMLKAMPGMDFFASEPLLALVRFGKWEQLLAEPKPSAQYPILLGLWLHGQGMAHASLGNLKAARADLQALRSLKISSEVRAGNSPAPAVLEVAALAVESRIAEKDRKVAEALRLWQAAVDAEDRLLYSEPADWFFPLRHCLGAALLDAGRFAEAEAVYRKDLARNPKNPWALFGLWKALAGQKKVEIAAQTQKEFQIAWQRADFPLSRSAF